jgi:hypothetical protein
MDMPSTTAADRIRCFPFSLRVVLSRDITDGLLSESNALHNLSAAVVLVLQPQLGWQSSQATMVVGTLGAKLMLSPPRRPGQDELRERNHLPQPVP